MPYTTVPLELQKILPGVIGSVGALLWIKGTWPWRIAIGFDQLVNVAANGHEDETISSRAARARDGGRRWGCLLCRLLDALDPGHCDKSRGT